MPVIIIHNTLSPPNKKGGRGEGVEVGSVNNNFKDAETFSLFFLFICFLAAPHPDLCQCRGDSLTNAFLITVF